MSMMGFGRSMFGAMASQRRAQGLPTPLLDRMQANGHMQGFGRKGGGVSTPPTPQAPPAGIQAFQGQAPGKPMAPPVMPMRPPVSQGMAPAPAPQPGMAPVQGMAPGAPQGFTPQLDANSQIATALMKRGRIG